MTQLPTTPPEGKGDLIARARHIKNGLRLSFGNTQVADLLDALIARVQSAEFALQRHYEQDISFRDRQAAARAHFTTYSENGDG